jgi:formylglycine-generating enzyme
MGRKKRLYKCNSVVVRSFILLIPTLVLLISSCAKKAPAEFVLVKGGVFKNARSGYYQKQVMVPDFFIGAHEVTQKEWMEVMGTNPSKFVSENLPVETVSWYDCIHYCNKRSSKEGLRPYYNITNDTIVTINKIANGYRLPTEIEWEYAAGGGQSSMYYVYSGSNNINDIAWYWKNSGDKLLDGNWSWTVLEQNHNKPKPVGSKQPNELGIYDMSGNVREWCFDWQAGDDKGNMPGRVWKGGGWIGADFCCEISFRASFDPNGKGPDQGFRVCRNK